jgi:cobalt-zinc-cadmium efflux system protein
LSIGRTRKLGLVLLITSGYLVAQVVGGVLAGSLALLADAGHMLTDVGGLALALFAISFTRRPATPQRTFGFYRLEILASLTNTVVLILLSIFIMYEAYTRIVVVQSEGHQQYQVHSIPMIIVAAIGLGVNFASIQILGRIDGHGHHHNHHNPSRSASPGQHHGGQKQEQPQRPSSNLDPVHNNNDNNHNDDKPSLYNTDKDDKASGGQEAKDGTRRTAQKVEDLPLEGARLEVLSDALGSVGVIVAGVLILFTNLYIIDPIVSIGIAIFILPRTWSLMNKSIHILMEGVPSSISYEEVRKAILEVKGVTGLFDLHIWSITSGVDALSAHVVVMDPRRSQSILQEINSLLENRFGITHATIQIEGYHSHTGSSV